MSTTKTVSRRLITPKSWGARSAENIGKNGSQRQCSACGRHGLVPEQSIAGVLFRCPSCKKLQF